MPLQLLNVDFNVARLSVHGLGIYCCMYIVYVPISFSRTSWGDIYFVYWM